MISSTRRSFASARADAKRNPGISEQLLHADEFFRTRHTKTKVGEIIVPVGMQNKPMMLVVHAQVAAISFALIDDFKRKHLARKGLPRREIAHAETYIAKFGDLNHGLILIGYRA